MSAYQGDVTKSLPFTYEEVWGVVQPGRYLVTVITFIQEILNSDGHFTIAIISDSGFNPLDEMSTLPDNNWPLRIDTQILAGHNGWNSQTCGCIDVYKPIHSIKVKCNTWTPENRTIHLCCSVQLLRIK